MEELIGSLQHASTVVQCSKPFLARLYALIKGQKSLRRKIKITQECKKDIIWWNKFILDWNGINILYQHEWLISDKHSIYSDACEKGYGAISGINWIQGKWTQIELDEAFRFKSLSMVYLEFKVLVLAASTFGANWSGKRIIFRTDNISTVCINDSKYSKNSKLMYLLRTLYFIAYQYKFCFEVKHISGITNTVADAISRYQDFHHLVPNCCLLPTPIIPLPSHNW